MTTGEPDVPSDQRAAPEQHPGSIQDDPPLPEGHSRWPHAQKLDPILNKTCRMVTGCIKTSLFSASTPSPESQILQLCVRWHLHQKEPRSGTPPKSWNPPQLLPGPASGEGDAVASEARLNLDQPGPTWTNLGQDLDQDLDEKHEFMTKGADKSSHTLTPDPTRL